MAAVFARVNLLLASLLIFSCVPFSTAASIDPRKRVLRCALPDSRAVAALQTLASNSPEIDVWRVGKSDFDASVGSKAARVLETAFSCSVFIDDVTALLDEEVAASRVYSLLPSLNEPSNAQRVISRPAFDHDRYLDYPSIQALLSSYAAANPSLAEFLPSIGLPTWEGRNISCIKIRKSADSVRKQVLFTGGIHAREWIAPATVLYITDHLLQSARDAEIAIKRGSKPDDLAARVSALLASGVEWILCPSINPDGYSYSHSPSGQRLWRKNRRSNGLGSYGVDLNRNFPIHWGETGGSSLPFSEIYQGNHLALHLHNRSLTLIFVMYKDPQLPQNRKRNRSSPSHGPSQI